MQTRTLTFEGKLFRVTRLHTSGNGPDYNVAFKDPTGKETFQLLAQEKIVADAAQAKLYEACARLFDDHVTYAKHIGSTSFWQAQGAPGDGGNKS